MKRQTKNVKGGWDQLLPDAAEVAALPVVALVGRPNTGKSTLFNGLTRSRRALVAAQPGVTRDRNVGVAEYGGRRFLLVDTGGFEDTEEHEIGRAVRGQAVIAAEQADVVIVVVDGRAGVSPHDEALLERLRAIDRPMFVAVNKIDTIVQEHLPADFYSLGVDRLFPISAEHAVDIDVLMDAVVERLPEAPAANGVPAIRRTAVAIIGRPNVGKSSLVNQLLGYERAIVTDIPGTTRDALDTPLTHEGREYLLVDTAGIRRRPKVHEHLERASVVRAFRALERAHVGLLVIDAVEGLTEQDARVAGYAWQRGRALVCLVNKWDAVEKGKRDRSVFTAKAEERFPSLAVIPKLFISALTGSGVQKIWKSIDMVVEAHRARIPTPELNRVLQEAIRRQAPAAVRGRRPRLLYAAQTATGPPTIMIFGSAEERISRTYRRYLANQLREAFPLEGTPLVLIFKARDRKARK